MSGVEFRALEKLSELIIEEKWDFGRISKNILEMFSASACQAHLVFDMCIYVSSEPRFLVAPQFGRMVDLCVGQRVEFPHIPRADRIKACMVTQVHPRTWR